MTVSEFIDRWSTSQADEQANAQSFLNELCKHVLEVEPPEPSVEDPEQNTYAFERRVDLTATQEGQRGYIDLYKKGCFVLEAKQGSNTPEITEAEVLGVREPKRTLGTARRGQRSWEQAMTKAKNQARRYARALPDEDGWPPFLIVVDIGYCIDLYADFARQGKNYVPFPDKPTHRVFLEDLKDENVREVLRTIWTEPLELDPTRQSTAVTRELADKLAMLAQSLEQQGHAADDVAGFLMRSLFTMFAEDVGLLPERSFTGLLADYRGNLDAFPKALEHLWTTMDEGGFEPGLKTDVRQFNGGLFADRSALPISEAQLELLIQAAEADWTNVEPAIFGTLLERALDPRERHKLGAHFTPRAYVERLVVPTVIEPLRDEWAAAQTAAAQLEATDEEDEARQQIVDFHRRLCSVKVLDPACGSGNFLYVTLEHLKRLEAEVLDVLNTYAGQQTLDMTGGYRVSPEQLLGLEINPRAAAIADVVLWIGYLQWHFRTYGSADRLDAPILKDTGNIECRDAVLAYDEKVPRTDEDDEPVTRWDRRTYKEDPTTGEMVPDETAQEPVYDYTNPQPAEWPEADFIMGNPPFVGNKRMRDALGEGYTEAVRNAYLYKVPKSADFVMFWWYKAAKAVRGKLDNWNIPAEQFGFVSTNSISQTFNRKVMEKQINTNPSVNLVFAIPDHPWVAGRDGADVRIAMTVGAVSDQEGTLQEVMEEGASDGIHWNVQLKTRQGNILPDLTIGADVAGAGPLEANDMICYRGFNPVGRGFVLSRAEAVKLGLGSSKENSDYIKAYMNGRDLTQRSRDVFILDLHGLTKQELRKQLPSLYQHVRDHVKPERDQNNEEYRRENWWLFGRPGTNLRNALDAIDRFIATPYVSKHRFFQFLNSEICPDDGLVNIAIEDAYYLGVLCSRIHVTWAMAAGGRLGVGNDSRYNNTQCFDPFPFPLADENEKAEIRDLGEQLDRHRKQVLDRHEDLTMTGLYNVLEKERALKQDDPQGASGETLDEDEREIHEKGLVGVLHEIHDELDAAVARAYGWEPGLPEDEILQRLVDLNAKRKAEEEQGKVRWLRPEYQAPEEVAQQSEMDLDIDLPDDTDVLEPMSWPSELKERAQAIRLVMEQSTGPLTVEQVAQHFHRARRKDVRGLLETLDALGLVEKAGEGVFAA
ncbi:SAM-dependent methyltransferase [Longibacter salinarum]|uniref:site-specific DNA-methyltransferase (adenine-specific) n=1 Tax=Longibacter salinarum TaxID=1850348 RepID=A0A2A8D1V9_9BACT|nr:DNA methyltransferase [Longibacter salinarum]PEN14803.1 SAM-dependent methyltransferase [Longibacter salinarum]